MFAGRKRDQESNELSRHPCANESGEKCEGKALDEKQPNDASRGSRPGPDARRSRVDALRLAAGADC